MRYLFLVFSLFLTHLSFSQDIEFIPESGYCDTLSGEPVAVKYTNGLLCDCTKMVNGTLVVDPLCENVGLCIDDFEEICYYTYEGTTGRQQGWIDQLGNWYDYDFNKLDTTLNYQIPCDACCSFRISTNRGGIQDERFFSNFEYGSITAPDWETFMDSYKRNGGSIHQVCVSFACDVSIFYLCDLEFSQFTYEDENGVRQEILTSCSQDQEELFNRSCLEKRTFTIGYDNGLTPNSVSNDCDARVNSVHRTDQFKVVGWEVNGQMYGQGITLGPYPGWTEQLNAWRDFFNANDPNNNSNAAFNFVGSPTWRYVEITGCDPDAEYGNLILKRVSDGCEFVVHPVFDSSEKERVYEYGIYAHGTNDKEVRYCKWSDKAEDWIDISTPEDVDCFVPCGYKFESFIAQDAGSPCVTQIIQDACDELTDGTLVELAIILTDCGTERSIELFKLDNYLTADNPDDLILYTLQGNLVDCLTGEDFEFPTPEFPEYFSTECKTACLKGVQIDVIIGYDSEGKVIWYKDEYGNIISTPDFNSSCPPRECETESLTICANGDFGTIVNGDQFLGVFQTCNDGSSELLSMAAFTDLTQTVTIPTGFSYTSCAGPDLEFIGCFQDENGVAWNGFIVDGVDQSYQSIETGDFGTPSGKLEPCPINQVFIDVLEDKHCINVKGDTLEAFLILNEDGTFSAKVVGTSTIYASTEYSLVSCCPAEDIRTPYYAGFTVSRDPANSTGMNSGWNNQFIQNPPALNGDFELCYTVLAHSGNTPNMLGINADPNSSANYTSIDCALYLRSLNGSTNTYQFTNGSNTGLISTLDFTGKEYCYKRVGGSLTYTLDGSTIGSCTIGTGTVYLDDSHFYNPTTTWNNGAITYSDFELVERLEDTSIKSVKECCCEKTVEQVADVSWDFCSNGEKVKVVTYTDNTTLVYGPPYDNSNLIQNPNLGCCDCLSCYQFGAAGAKWCIDFMTVDNVVYDFDVLYGSTICEIPADIAWFDNWLLTNFNATATYSFNNGGIEILQISSDGENFQSITSGDLSPNTQNSSACQ